MPSSHPQLSLDEVRRYVVERVFTPVGSPSVGIELEWLTTGDADGTRPDLETLERIAAARLPHDSSITIEPGGQLEISTRPLPAVGSACEAAADDLYVLEERCRRLGVGLVALGLDPTRDPERIVVAPRYRAMEHHFDLRGPAGRTMMCNTAAIQLNVAMGDAGVQRSRWRVAHGLGPVLIAAFANSPLAAGRPSGWKSTRMRAWWDIDHTRTAPVAGATDPAIDPAEAWTDYALSANVMLVRTDPDAYEPETAPTPFGAWLLHGGESGWPTVEDLEYHLTTLFPPVRPRGWLELRMLDSLPTPFWHVATAVTSILLDSTHLHTQLMDVLAPTVDRWIPASREGLEDPAVARAAATVFRLALEALVDAGADDATVAITRDYCDRYLTVGRCPGDDLVDLYQRTGGLLPPAESPIPYADLEAAWS